MDVYGKTCFVQGDYVVQKNSPYNRLRGGRKRFRWALRIFFIRILVKSVDEIEGSKKMQGQ